MHKYLCTMMEYYSEYKPINIMEIGNEICDKNYHISRKYSPIYALEYIVSGSNKYNINGVEFVANAGDVVFLPKKTTHNYYLDAGECEKMWFVFDGKLVEQLVHFYLEKTNCKFYCPSLSNVFVAIIETAKAESKNIDILTAKLSLLLHQIFIELHKLAFQNIAITTENKIMKYIDDNLNKPFSLEVISQKFGYSKNHIIILFKKKYKITPNQYYISKKANVACLYLKNTTYSIKQISENLGYADQHYFTNSFISIIKTTPTQYRQLCASLNLE